MAMWRLKNRTRRFLCFKSQNEVFYGKGHNAALRTFLVRTVSLDVLFINPGNTKVIFHDLAKDYSSIEYTLGFFF